MKKLDERGIGILELFLMLIIVGLIGFIGWYVWNSKTVATTALTAAAKTDSEQKIKLAPSVKEACSLGNIAGQRVYNRNDKFSFCAPKGWHFVYQYEGFGFWLAASVANTHYDKTKPVVLAKSPTDLQLADTDLVIAPSDDISLHLSSDYGYTTIPPKQAFGQGVTVQSYYMVLSHDTTQEHIPDGTKQYSYIAAKGSQPAVAFGYSVQPGVSDQSELIKQMAASIQ